MKRLVLVGLGALLLLTTVSAHDDPHTWRYDHNQDWKVTSIDKSLEVQNYGDPCVDVYYDTNGDGKCSSIDLSLIAQHEGLNAYRDKYDLPFSSSLWWNVPIGTGATRESAGFSSTTWINTDRVQFFREDVAAPAIPLYQSLGSCNRSGQSPAITMNIDLSDWIDPTGEAGNGIVAYELDDNTVLVTQPTAKCTDANGTYLRTPWTLGTAESIYGTADPGGHGGSRIGGYAGAITRRDVLFSPGRMRHALNLNIYCGSYCDNGGQEVWPATAVDSCWQTCYGGTNPELTMGSLLALPTSYGCTFTSGSPQQWLCQTLKWYGAYVTDDTAWSGNYAFTMEQDARLAFESKWGFHPSQSSSATGAAGQWYSDVMAMVQALEIITNNGPTNVGGGGSPVGGSFVPTPSAFGN